MVRLSDIYEYGFGGEIMRIIPEHELAPDDNPCEDCSRIRVTPITITDCTWRPDDWMKISNRIRAHFDQARSVIVNRDVYEAGASAMLAALIAWGEGICDHNKIWTVRHLCPQCWQELTTGAK